MNFLKKVLTIWGIILVMSSLCVVAIEDILMAVLIGALMIGLGMLMIYLSSEL